MHKIAIVLLSLMLIVAPVYGQAIPTTPTPNASSIVRDVTEATQALGTVTVVVLAVLAVLVLIVVFFVIAVWRLGMPLVNTVQKLMDTIRDLMDARDRRDLDDDTRKQAQITVLERYKALLEDIETKEDAAKSRKTAVTQINTHTDEVVKPVDDKLKTVAATLEELKRDVVTKQVLTDTIDPLVKKIDAALQVIHDLQQPADPPAAESPSAARDTVEQVDTNSKAKE